MIKNMLLAKKKTNKAKSLKSYRPNLVITDLWKYCLKRGFEKLMDSKIEREREKVFVDSADLK